MTAHITRLHRTSKPNKINLNQILLFLGIFLVVFFLGKKLLTNSFFITRSWRVNVVIYNHPTIVLSFPHDQNDQILVITIPDNLYVKVPYGYGYYQMDAIWRLAALEKRPEIYTESISQLLGIKIHGLIGNDQGLSITDEDNGKLITDLQKLKFYHWQHTTNLQLLDKLLLSIDLIGLKADQVKIYKLGVNNIYSDDKLPDGTAIKVINASALNAFLEQKFQESTIRNDDLSCEIVNTTTTSGLGTQFAKIIQNTGAKVILIKNDLPQIENCDLYIGENLEDKLLVKYLHTEYDCKIYLEKSSENADVVVKLGARFSKIYQ